MYTLFFAAWLLAAHAAHADSLPPLTPEQKTILLQAWTQGCMVPQVRPIDPIEQAYLIEECIKATPPEWKN